MTYNKQIAKNLDRISRYVQGGVSEGIMSLIDALIDEGDIDQEWFDANEIDFLTAVDELFFECEICCWTVPIDTMADIEDERICNDCA